MADPSKRAEITRRVAGAEKLLQRGKTEDALEEYLQILLEDPENDNVRQLSADLCLSLNRNGQAVRLLGELFERQMQGGDAMRASLTYKKLARYGNPTWQQKVRFGELLESSNKKLAIGTYENALDDISRSSRNVEDSLPVLKRLVALEPTHQNYLRLGELSVAGWGSSECGGGISARCATGGIERGESGDLGGTRVHRRLERPADRACIRQEPAGAR